MPPRMAPLLLALALSLLLAAPAQAADPIEGTWFFSGGQVAVEPSGPGTFTGTVTKATTFDRCTHPAGQRMWSIEKQPDGTYKGTHIRYRSTCEEVPNSPSIWRTRTDTASGKQVLDFCSNDPSAGPPTAFDSSCLVLERAAAPPDRTRACGTDTCLEGPRDLETLGCLRRGSFTHRFRVALKKRRNGTLVNRRSRVRLVTFTLDGRPNGSARRRPFVAVVNGATLTAGPHVLRATVRLRVPNTTKRFTRRLVFRFNGCA